LDIIDMGDGKVFARRSAPDQKQSDEQCGKERYQTLHTKPPWIGIEYFFANLYKMKIDASCQEGQRNAGPEYELRLVIFFWRQRSPSSPSGKKRQHYRWSLPN
jgi:hypothetical protein